jgi:hypothetical protein
MTKLQDNKASERVSVKIQEDKASMMIKLQENKQEGKGLERQIFKKEKVQGDKVSKRQSFRMTEKVSGMKSFRKV